jgi:VWFA-related protein
MRQLLQSVTVVAVLAAAGHAAQEPQRFRGGVDLITVDVSAVDSRGRPIEDLKAGDFVVKVDGKPRPIVSAELIKVERDKPAAPATPANALISSNDMSRNARRIIVAVDQTLIAPGMIAPLQRSAAQFVDRLRPDDYAAFVAFPEPGPRVDFTTDKARVRKAMEGIVGQPQQQTLVTEFNISLSEALIVTGAESTQDSSDPPDPANIRQLLSGPTMRRILLRGCPGRVTGLTADEVRQMEDTGMGTPEQVEELRWCRRGAYSESLRIATDARVSGDISLRALERLLRDLIPLEGPKSMIVFSAGLVNDNPLLLEDLGRLAAEARTTINVIAVDRQREQDVATRGATTGLLDRSHEMQGLELVADNTGGTLFKGVASGAGIFEELEAQLSAWYLVAVARQPGDPERQRIEVEVKRRGVAVRSNRNSVTASAARPMTIDANLSDALSSPFALPGISLRVATFTQRDAEPGKYRVRIAAQVGQPGQPATEFGLGYAIADEKGKVLTTAGSRRTLSPLPDTKDQPLPYESAFTIEPGSYALRFAVVNADGRRGAVVHRLELPKLDEKELGSSDLIVGNLPAEGEVLHPNVEPAITSGELAGYLEVYLNQTDRERVTVTLEIAEGEATPALAQETLKLRPGDQPTWEVATGVVEANMTPGRYLARATIRQDGVVVRTVSRPISIVRDPRLAVTTTPRRRAAPITPDLQRRAASYVAGVVNGLANLVAQEEFTLSGPDRRVVSDLLLVRYPGSQRDLIPYRDVVQVNGAPLAGRDERLVELFVKPTDGLRQRATQIMLDADKYVPAALNPMFVIGFFQSDFQSRFDLTVSDAGDDWPREVKAVTFAERGRPTLLRAGPFADQDVPTRGVVWIEEATGRILQTELEIGRGRGVPKMTTKFKLDDRLQVTVPVEMRTQNPDGVATYTNFRRFGVDSSAVIPTPAPEAGQQPSPR